MNLCAGYLEKISKPMQLEKADLTPFGDWLRSSREARGFTMRELADKAEISHAHVSKLESGRANPSREMVNRLAKELNASENEGMIAAGYVPPGHTVVPIEAPRKFTPKRTLDNYEDFREQYFWLTDAEAELHWNSIISRKPQESTKL